MANEKRLIDANDLKQKAVPHYFDNCCYAVSVKDIDDTPTVDAVEVVRCKDCKHCIYISRLFGDVRCGYLHTDYIKEDSFCSYGERREGE